MGASAPEGSGRDRRLVTRPRGPTEELRIRPEDRDSVQRDVRPVPHRNGTPPSRPRLKHPTVSRRGCMMEDWSRRTSPSPVTEPFTGETTGVLEPHSSGLTGSNGGRPAENLGLDTLEPLQQGVT